MNLPKFIRKDNILPFCITDIFMLEAMNDDIEQAIKRVLGDKFANILSAKAKKIECNITQRVSGDSTCAQVLDLINRSYYEGTNVVYQRASSGCRHFKKNESVIIRKPNYHILKCYDKSREQRKLGNAEVEDGLLRIEIIMQERLIKKLFAANSTIRDVLTRPGLIKIIEEYKRTYIEDVMVLHIRPCCTDIANILLKSLKETDSLVETVALYKELIMDEKILREALRKWHKSKGKPDYSRHDICRLKSRGHEFPKDVIRTLKDFELLCR